MNDEGRFQQKDLFSFAVLQDKLADQWIKFSQKKIMFIFLYFFSKFWVVQYETPGFIFYENIFKFL